MRRKPVKFIAALLTASTVSLAFIPSAPIMADQKIENEEETDCEEEEDLEENGKEDTIFEPEETVEESYDPPEYGGGEEETTDSPEAEEDAAQAESDLSGQDDGTDSDGETEGIDTEDSSEESDIESENESEEETESESKEESESETQTDSKSRSEDENSTQEEIVDAAENDSGKESGNAKEKTKNAADDSSEQEGSFDIIRTGTEEEEVAGTSWDFSNSYNSGSYWDSSWYVQSDFRFTQVDKVPVISEGSVNGISVYSATGDSKRIVGILPYFSIAYILDDNVGDGWIYVESGDVRGFIKEEEAADEAYSQELVDSIGEDNFEPGIMTCEKADNEAYTYTKTTVYDVLAEKVYAVSLVEGNIFEYPRESARAVGEAASGTLAYILEDTKDGWLFVESGDVRGFIPSSSILSGEAAEGIVKEVGEEEIVKATQLIDPEDNRSLYYTLKSVVTTADAIGEQIAKYALSLVGTTKYVWGGTDLMLGADCSGFTQSIFAAFGINIPRLAEEQGASGELISSLSDAKPGDIIYYASGPHVGIYIGNGQVVQCSGGSANTADNPGRGATVSAADYMGISCIRRYIIPDTERSSSGAGDNTNYSQSDLELIWAIVCQEDNGSYEGALAVISSAMNRAESPEWSYLGTNALSQLTAPGQYCYSLDLNWVRWLGGNVPDYVKQAVSDCLDKGIRNHNYTSFRSYYIEGSVQIAGGNFYFS